MKQAARRRVRGVERVHRPDDADVVDRRRDVGQQSADVNAAAAVLLELERRGQQAAGGALGAQIDRRRPLALILQQRGLGIEHVQLRRPARHEQHDVVLGLGWKIRKLRNARFGRPGAQPLLGEHAGEAENRAHRRGTQSNRAAKADSVHLLNIMAKKLPRSTPATPERIAPAFRCPDTSTPCPVPADVGSRSTASRYMSRIFAGTSGCVVHALHQVACALLHERAVHDEQLLQRRSSQFAPRSRHHRVGEIVERQQRIQASAADAAVHRRA